MGLKEKTILIGSGMTILRRGAKRCGVIAPINKPKHIPINEIIANWIKYVIKIWEFVAPKLLKTAIVDIF